ncbi:phosphoenolpyruvate carboxylase [Candidatus Woesearchaeota archaeon]|nr:phosphoenolpyruvate carboxylase [Candidatus Woesearchaeota archaeon]
MPKISRLMSTQHPDNVSTPFFSSDPVIAGDEEVQEAFYAFSHLGIDEQLWDAEGKEVDGFVVKKLFSRYESFFRKNVLGKDKLLTIRVPNPDVEKAEGKVLIEALSSIPRNHDLGRLFYGRDIPPIFEVVVPMCLSEKPLIRIHEYYKQHIVNQQDERLVRGDITIAKWLGRFMPKDIRMTPLFETEDAILHADDYAERYMRYERISELQRVWFARSDPALNYGSAAAVILIKVGLARLHRLQERTGVPILPIIGCGSAPFRGNFTPANVKGMLKNYPSIQTFTVQSAFKYDYQPREVMGAVETVAGTRRREPIFPDEKKALAIFGSIKKEYVGAIRLLAPAINRVAPFVPHRRKRKLHVGLFGYSRKTGGVALPRAIRFTASLYSLGLPPEILGMACLSGAATDELRRFYPTLDEDLADSLRFYNPALAKDLPAPVRRIATAVAERFPCEPDAGHAAATAEVVRALGRHDAHGIQEGMLKAARIRQFLG